MAGNNIAAYHQHQHQFSSVATANNSTNVGSTFYGTGMPMLPRDELPTRHLSFDFEVKPPVPAVVSSPSTGGYHQDQAEAAALLVASSAPEQPPSGQDMEARTKQLEKRQEAKQRYKDKKKNRKYASTQFIHWWIAVISTTPSIEIIFAIAFAGLASRSCTSPGRCEQTHETESGADLQRRAAAVATAATISLHSIAMRMSSLQILAYRYRIRGSTG